MATDKRPTPATPATPAADIFSEAQRRTLTALAEGFVAGGGASRAAAAETAIAKVVDPALHGQLRLVLNLLDTRVGGLLIGGSLARFGTLKAAQRDQFLRRWVQHPVPMLRSGAAVFRKLLSFIAYSDADEPADELVRTRLSALGYNPTPNPTTANVTQITAFDPGDAERIAVDVLVIGSGAGGGSIARDLSAAGREVLVIEAGGLYTEATFPTKERDAYERLYLDSGFTATADAHIAILAGGTVGGGTTVNWMASIPTPEPVREEWEGEHGVTGAAGAEFGSDLDAVLKEIGAKESQNVPLKDAAIIRGAEKLGWSSERLQVNRAECSDCGTCTFGCKVGSKQSSLRLHLAQAVANGARILPDCKAERLVIENGTATGAITTVGTRAGSPRTLEIIAKTVVVSGGALRTPVLLQRSGLTHPRYRQEPPTASGEPGCGHLR